MKIMLPFLAAAIMLSGCSVDPQQAAVRRDQLIQQVFPDPADQYGLDLVFPLESGGIYPTLEVAYFTQEVTEPEVRRRVASFCARQNSSRLTGQAVVKKDIGLSTRKFADGRSKPVHTLFYSCVKSA